MTLLIALAAWLSSLHYVIKFNVVSTVLRLKHTFRFVGRAIVVVRSILKSQTSLVKTLLLTISCWLFLGLQDCLAICHTLYSAKRRVLAQFEYTRGCTVLRLLVRMPSRLSLRGSRRIGQS
jgi:hypothetical protein